MTRCVDGSLTCGGAEPTAIQTSAAKTATNIRSPRSKCRSSAVDGAPIHPTPQRCSNDFSRAGFHHHVSGVRAQERRVDAHRRMCVVLRMRALQGSGQTETRGLLRVLLVRYQQVPAYAAFWLLLRLIMFTQLARRDAEAGRPDSHSFRKQQ